MMSSVKNIFLVSLIQTVISYDSMKSPPRADKNNVKHIAKVGDEVKIVCPVHSNPAPIVTWSKDGEGLIDYAWIRFRLHKKQMKIKGVVKEDTGFYTCKAINGFGSVEIKVELIVINPEELTGVSADDINKLSSPSFSRQTLESEKSVIRSVGSDLRLQCSAAGFPAPTIQWYKDDQLFQTSGSEISLRSLQIRDSGAYSCVARNIIGTSSQTFTVNIRTSSGQAPVVASPNPSMLGPANISVEQGDTATLDCKVKTGYKPNIKWLKKLENMEMNTNSEVINVGSDYYRMIEASSAVMRTEEGEYLSELILSNARPEDEGMYICFVTSLNGGFNFKPSYLTVVQKSDTNTSSSPDSMLMILIISVSIVTTLLLLAAVACLVQRKQKTSSVEQQSQDTVTVEVTPDKPIFKRQGSGSYDKPSFTMASSRLEDLLTQSTPLNSPDTSQNQAHYFITQQYQEHYQPDHFSDPYSGGHNIYEVPSHQRPALPHYPAYGYYYESAQLNNSFNSSYSSNRR